MYLFIYVYMYICIYSPYRRPHTLHPTPPKRQTPNLKLQPVTIPLNPDTRNARVQAGSDDCSLRACGDPLNPQA